MIASLRQIIPLIPRADRTEAVKVGLALLGASFLEVVGVGMVLPLLAVFTGASGNNWPLVQKVRSEWLSGHEELFVLIALAVFVLVLVVKSAAAFGAQSWAQSFRLLASHRMSVDLFSRHMTSRYEYAIGVNSADVLNLCRHTVGNVFSGLVTPLMTLIADGAMVVLTLGMMVAAEPSASVVAGLVVGVPALLTHRVLRRRNRELGKQREALSTTTIKTLQESLGAFKEFSVLGRQSVPITRFQAEDRRYMDAIIANAQLALVPRMVLEIAAMLGLLAFCWMAFLSGRQPSEIVPLLGLMAAAVLRMMPAALRVVGAFNTINFSEASLVKVHQAFADLAAHQLEPLAADASMPAPWSSLSFEDVRFRYRGAEDVTLDHVSFSLARGDVLGIVGSSGSGKSTLIDLLVGLLLPTGGRILLDGTELSADGRSWTRHVGYVSQNIYLADDTVRRNVAIGVSDELIDAGAVDRALRLAQIDGFVAGLPQGLDTIVGERGAFLSGGQRQRLVLARALYGNPELLVLDEATSALDTAIEADILATLAGLKGQMTIVLVTHRLSALAICDRVLKVDKGRVSPVALAEIVS